VDTATKEAVETVVERSDVAQCQRRNRLRRSQARDPGGLRRARLSLPILSGGRRRPYSMKIVALLSAAHHLVPSQGLRDRARRAGGGAWSRAQLRSRHRTCHRGLSPAMRASPTARPCRSAPAFVPWAWGVNGIFSVLAPVLSVAFSITGGINALLLAAVPIYLGVRTRAARIICSGIGLISAGWTNIRR